MAKSYRCYVYERLTSSTVSVLPTYRSVSRTTISKRMSNFYTILEDYDDVPTKAGKMKKMKTDPHYNVLQVKYAYAVTCHKAQGGQWMNVFLDIGYITEEMLGEDFYRWLYTAFTRATHRLYLVNLPEEFEEYASS